MAQPLSTGELTGETTTSGETTSKAAKFKNKYRGGGLT